MAEDSNHDPRPLEISGSTLCSRQPCEWYTSHPSGVCEGCRLAGGSTPEPIKAAEHSDPS